MVAALRRRFGRIFYGAAAAIHRARARYQINPPAAIPQLKFGRILGTIKGQGFAELRHNGVLRSSHSPSPLRKALRRQY